MNYAGDRSVVQLVRDLVATYISKPSCLILLTVTCDSELHVFFLTPFLPLTCRIVDFENQHGAYNMVRVYDPDGKRTIGS